ncbi:MAG: transcription antitermination factor NusB [Phycisphaerae bacterium]|nr:transcription antitermination factor NusB [Phycisphaerae bacterium]
MIDRRHARTLAMQALCVFDHLGDEFAGDLDAFLGDENPPAEVRKYARSLVDDYRIDRSAIDECIQSVVENWELKRLAPIDRNVLRIAVCELFHRPEVPPKVAINEAIEIGKTFGTMETGAFINGILDAVMKQRTAGASEATAEPVAQDSLNGDA